jgi:hypothetical protein
MEGLRRMGAPEIAWEDDDLGLRLGVEGDAGEWE